MKVTLSLHVTNDNGSEFSTTTHQNANLTKAEAIAYRDYLAVEVPKVLNGFATIAAELKKTSSAAKA